MTSGHLGSVDKVLELLAVLLEKIQCIHIVNALYVLRNTNHSIFKVNQILRELSREWPGHSYEAREASDTGKQFAKEHK